MASTWKVIFGTAGFVVPVTVTILDVFGYIAKVEGTSMQPVLNPNDQRNPDYVLLNKWAARNYEFTRGEIVSLISPSNPEQKIIKRIIGLPGDDIRTLNYKNRNVVVPRGHIWIEGDHHEHSLDSNLFGPVSMGLISAKAPYIVWPPSRWQKLEHFFPDKRINNKPALISSLFPFKDEDDDDKEYDT